MASEKIIEQKKQAVNELAEKLKAAKGIVFTDYRGLTVEQDTRLRKEMREAGIEYKVIKNSIARYAVKESKLEGLEEMLLGPTAMAINNEDSIISAKITSKFAKEFKLFEIKGGAVEGAVMDVEGIMKIATLPSKEELIAKMLGSMNAPITGLVTVLNGTIKGLAVALNAIAEQKQAAGEA